MGHCDEITYGKKWGQSWTDEDIDFLLENAPKMTTAELATALERTERGVYFKLRVLGVRCVPKHKWAKRETWRSGGPLPKSLERKREEARERMALLREKRNEERRLLYQSRKLVNGAAAND